MSRYSQARLNKEAAGFEAEAKRAAAAARDGDRAAKDPNLDTYNQGVAARCAAIARSNAREYREIAAALRDGEIPEGVRLDLD
ncbi:hypothetical protein [Streptomyces yunnanensis]|uniref:Uncharacterized protein n=1 Tax=Streptomyces yunnanensis TaxID=156453 RepID=A0A9X8QSB1_9ACTN|nr:hypothetical protein [Streptomyces yunnanensis]SHL75148.1 hypothetical protein SAMN05216268_10673 [Streptomyces yunnanensis]